jgi:multicomponent Na+:H+ antiporter subunit E
MPSFSMFSDHKISRDMRTSVAKRLLLLSGLWWLMVPVASASAWLVGVPAILCAGLASAALSGGVRSGVSLRGLPAFALVFVRQSFSGGIDVARRTLAPTLNIAPGFAYYRLRNQAPLARVLVVNCISLLPGTLAARLVDDRVELHLLDARQDPQPELLELERAVARLFGQSWEDTHG